MVRQSRHRRLPRLFHRILPINIEQCLFPVPRIGCQPWYPIKTLHGNQIYNKEPQQQLGNIRSPCTIEIPRYGCIGSIPSMVPHTTTTTNMRQTNEFNPLEWKQCSIGRRWYRVNTQLCYSHGCWLLRQTRKIRSRTLQRHSEAFNSIKHIFAIRRTVK